MGSLEDKKSHLQNKFKSLGMCPSKARRLLVNKIIYKFFAALDEKPFCFRCGEEITEVPDEVNFHIDHKTAWLHEDNAVDLYFDLANLALSHPACNSMAHRHMSTRSVKDRVINEVQNKRAQFKRYWARRKKLRNEES